jgi:hypothetical protein
MTPIDPLEMPLFAGMLLVRNMALALMPLAGEVGVPFESCRELSAV